MVLETKEQRESSRKKDLIFQLDYLLNLENLGYGTNYHIVKHWSNEPYVVIAVAEKLHEAGVWFSGEWGETIGYFEKPYAYEDKVYEAINVLRGELNIDCPKPNSKLYYDEWINSLKEVVKTLQD